MSKIDLNKHAEAILRAAAFVHAEFVIHALSPAYILEPKP